MFCHHSEIIREICAIRVIRVWVAVEVAVALALAVDRALCALLAAYPPDRSRV